jgi:hypothetical protein
MNSDHSWYKQPPARIGDSISNTDLLDFVDYMVPGEGLEPLPCGLRILSPFRFQPLTVNASIYEPSRK